MFRFEELSSELAERTSRRGVLGRIGKATVAFGAAISGVARLTPAYASCSNGCSEGGCTDGIYHGCEGIGGGACTGNVQDCTACPPGEYYGWFWYCCNGTAQKILCQDCCDSNTGVYTRTCASLAGQCGYVPSS